MIAARNPVEHSVSFKVQEVQLDDQSAEITVHPVVFAPAAHVKRGEPFLEFSFVRAMDIADAYHVRSGEGVRASQASDHGVRKDLPFIFCARLSRYLALQMLPADLRVSDQFVWHLYQYAGLVTAATAQV